MMFVPHRTQPYGSPRPVTGTNSLFYIYMMFVPHRRHTYGPPRRYRDSFIKHRKHTYGPPRSVTEIALLFIYIDDVRTSQGTPMGLHGQLRGQLYFLIRRWCWYLTGNTSMDFHGLLRGELYFFICRWRVYVIGRKGRRKETTRKTET
jgi:hypothetical protein